ncbi:hypothetical protein [Novipirellula aureliae]|nr:hypothetical protein [Novipirellula aureliae]
MTYSITHYGDPIFGGIGYLKKKDRGETLFESAASHRVRCHNEE